MIVTASALNVRSGPGITFRPLGQLLRDTRVNVLERSGDWVWVDPGHGWVHSGFLAPVEVRAPNGLSAIRDTFGAPGSPAASAGRAVLPAALKLGWSPASVTSFACHVELADRFTSVFQRIHSAGLWSAIRTFDGCYNPRKKRGSDNWSTHAWGIAVDLNAATNGMGTPGDMDPRIVKIFVEAGFFWGGEWTGRSRDPMHFQFARGY